MSIGSVNVLPLGTFIAQFKKLYIPSNQRGYAWEEPQLEDFWIDLTNLLKEGENETHFLGQIVIYKDGDTPNIIDGQQRISTTIIFLDVIRTELKKLFDDTNRELEYIYETITDINRDIGRVSDRKNEPRLIMGDIDKDFFIDTIQSTTPIDYEIQLANKKHLKPSHLRIIKASEYFHKKITELLHPYESLSLEERTDKSFNTLEKVYNCLTERFQLISVESNDINEATDIFETLNTRGKPLETADLLKNHIIRIISLENPDISITTNIPNQWNNIIDTLEDLSPTQFIRYYWNASNDFIREKDLYKALRNKITDSAKADKLLKELKNLSDVFVAFRKPNIHTYFNTSELNDKILDLDSLGISAYLPIVFALELKNCSEKDLLEVLTSIETLVVRNITVAGFTANKYERLFSHIATRYISNTTSPNIEEIKKALLEEAVDDEKFKNDFQILAPKKPGIIRYLLRKINQNSLKETKVIEDPNAVHIEHIFPQKPADDEWINFAKNIRNDYKNLIGNLILLGHKLNKQAQNKEFKDKKQYYESSEIRITKELLSHNEWTPQTIKDRQNKFANLALSIWPIK